PRRDDAERALVAAEARLDQARATLARAEDARRHGDLTAPADGIVVAVFAEPGATLAAGEPVLRLAGIEAREVILDLSETDLADLPDAARFAVRLIADPALTAEARLTRIDPVAGRSTRTRRLHLTLVAPPPAFRLGALVRARAQHDQSAAISLPGGALVKPTGGGTAVWLVRRDAPAGAGTKTEGTVSLRTVVPGPAFGNRLRILDGLAPGDEVVVKGVHSLVEGQRVGRRLAP
ncbi:MAG: efflux RND transporter periplasmic adaptor subunit, partial [Alphaproteobacteria bacterium HGW-Alphaproteobacteria-6]